MRRLLCRFETLFCCFGLLLCCAGPLMAEPRKIIFDTDTAYFLDDGAALVMLLQRPDLVEIVGVTVVSGNLWARQGAEYMLHLLEVTGNGHIPLYLGAQKPLANTAERAQFQREHLGGLTYVGAFGEKEIHADGDLEPPFGGEFSEIRPQKQDAVSFLIDTFETQPGEITVLALGPMTNLAMALNLRPDLATEIPSLVFMGGALRVPGNTSPYAEFNFWFDPEAAQQVMRSAIPEKVMFGLDITNRAHFTKEQFEAIVAEDTPITRILKEDDARASWGFHANPDRTSFIWDCLAAAYLLDPSLFTEEELVPVDIETALGTAYGASYEPSGEPPPGLLPTRVMLDLDYPRFMELYSKLLTTWSR
ncbi:MAG: nucleoside hydrolase [Acidobacteriota bacterium]